MASPRSDPRRAQLLAHYAEGLNAAESARLVGVGDQQARVWIREAGVGRKRGTRPAEPTDNPVRVAALADLEATGDTIAAVAKRHGVAKTTLSKWRSLDPDQIAYKGEWVLIGGILHGSARDVA